MTTTHDGTGAATALLAATGTWTLDPSATTIELHTKSMWGLAKIKANFTAVEGSGVVDASGSVSGTVVVDLASIDSSMPKRDKHLRSKDFFDVESHPTATYAVSGSQAAADGQLTLTGALTLHGQTQPVELVATVTSPGTDRVTLTTETELDRSRWGVTWAKMGAKLDNQMKIAAVFVKA